MAEEFLSRIPEEDFLYIKDTASSVILFVDVLWGIYSASCLIYDIYKRLVNYGTIQKNDNAERAIKFQMLAESKGTSTFSLNATSQFEISQSRNDNNS
jgi:hypothetical protein